MENNGVIIFPGCLLKKIHFSKDSLGNDAIVLALNYLNNAIFSNNDSTHPICKWVGQLLCLIFAYGHGIHITNTLEIMARENGIAYGLIYDQIWWLDEELSHWIQFVSFFSLITWFILHDGLDIQQDAFMVVLTGILHGVDRGVGFIE